MAKQAAQQPQQNAISAVGHTPQDVYGLLAVLKSHLQRATPSNLDVTRLSELALMLVRKSPRLAECTRTSFGGALMQCAKFGLYPDVRGQAWLIPRKTGPKKPNGERWLEAHFQIGYQGALELARRSGQVTKIESRVVRSGDAFDYEYGTEPFIKHRPRRGGDEPGALEYAYAVAWLRNESAPQFLVLDRWEIERYRAVSRNTEDDDSPWVKWEPEMWQKTAVLRLANWLPMSIEQREALEADSRSEAYTLDVEPSVQESEKQSKLTLDDFMGPAPDETEAPAPAEA